MGLREEPGSAPSRARTALGPSGRSPQPELPVPRRLCRGGLSALQRIRQRRSLRCSCPPLFSPRAPGDAPVLPCLPESAAGWPGPAAGPAIGRHQGCAPAGVLCAAAVVWQRRRQAWLDGGMEPELWVGDGRRGEGDEEQTSSGVSTSWPGHRQPPPWLPVGNVSAMVSVTLSCAVMVSWSTAGTGTNKHGAGSCL